METGELKDKELDMKDVDLKAIFNLLQEQKEKIAKLEAAQFTNAGGQDLETIIKGVVTAVKEGDKGGLNVRDGIQLGQIPQDDLEEPGTIFCAPYSGYLITDFYKNGFRITPPYGIQSIFLELMASRRKREGKEEQIYHISMYKSQSKKLTAWLKQHPLFNVMFYESQKMMTNVDVRKAMLTAKLMQALQNWDALKIIKACKDFEVARHDDVEVMRQQLVMAMIEKDWKAEREIINTRIQDTAKTKKLLETNTEIIDIK